MNLRERWLVHRLQQRDERAFREMVRTYEAQVFNLVFRMLGNRQEAEDLAQDVFLTVFKSIDSFRGDSKLSTWLYRIAVNTCKNRYKYLARRRHNALQPLDEASEREAAAQDQGGPTIPLQAHLSRPDHLVEGRALEAALQRELENLEEEHRLLIVLRDVQGLSYQEIAAITQLPEGTVKSRLHRARMALKERLEKYM
ncbi:MAG: sigma-70 family RNA polymerase sigma factor [Deltaproteobacteria bacterium]|nr:sigma-70 family RNA polymerase sigma factor [Deltaproteobacteria bacterium]